MRSERHSQRAHHAAELIEGEPIPEVELDGRLVVFVVADLQSRVRDLAGELLDVILEAGEHLCENRALTLDGLFEHEHDTLAPDRVALVLSPTRRVLVKGLRNACADVISDREGETAADVEVDG